jgi:crossover junction endodeoxyribonuclease RuvC
MAGKLPERERVSVMRIIGIDNGKKGGLALVENGVLKFVQAMPTLGAKNEFDLAEVTNLFDCWQPDAAILERAHAMPGQGVVSMFTTGFCFGAMQGILAAWKIPYQIVSAQTWQKEMFKGQPKMDTKVASVKVAKMLWPTMDFLATRKSRIPHNGITDAALMAEYGSRIFFK